MLFPISKNSIHLFRQDLAVVGRISRLGLKELAGLIEPAIVSTFFNTVKGKENLVSQMGPLYLKANVIKNKLAFLGWDYLKNPELFFLKAMFSAVISEITSRILWISLSRSRTF